MLNWNLKRVTNNAQSANDMLRQLTKLNASVAVLTFTVSLAQFENKKRQNCTLIKLFAVNVQRFALIFFD